MGKRKNPRDLPRPVPEHVTDCWVSYVGDDCGCIHDEFVKIDGTRYTITQPCEAHRDKILKRGAYSIGRKVDPS